jgi:hypothetical protein
VLLARRFSIPVALVASVTSCGVLRLTVGPGVALPLGPVVAPVWLFAIAVAALVCLPVISTELTIIERQAVRYDWRFRSGRTAAFLTTYAAGPAVLAIDNISVSFVFMAVTASAVSLVLAAALGDVAVVVMLALSLVTIICSTYPWFADLLVTIDGHPELALVPLAAVGAAVALTV